MRLHAKVPTAGSTQRQATGLGRVLRGAFATRGASSDGDGSDVPSRVPAQTTDAVRRARHIPLVVVFLSIAALLSSAASASAATAINRTQLFTFDGTGSTAGQFANVAPLEIDQATGTVYVIDRGKNVLDKFNIEGAAQSFSATGSSSLAPGFEFNEYSDVAVDNYGPNAGRIHVMREFGPVTAFNPAGSSLWQLTGFSDVCGLAVDAAGHPWIGDYSNSLAREYASSGNPPAQIGSLNTGSKFTGPDRPCRLDFAANGNAYINRWNSGVDKYEGGVKTAIIDQVSSIGVTVDQSSPSGHIFTLHEGSFTEFDHTGMALGTIGGGTIGNGQGIAYLKAFDIVYVADSATDVVRVFGPAESLGTVPDLTIDQVVSETLSTAEFSGSVNAQGVPNSYHFEYKPNTDSNWGSATSTPSESVTEDSAPHSVSFSASGLSAGATYEVRLVAENTDLGLKSISPVVQFKTGKPAAVTIDDPSSVTVTTALLTGTVDPIDSETSWRFRTSSNPNCASGVGFTNRPLNVIPPNEGVVPVEEELTDLLPNQHYCVQIEASSSPGTVTSEIKEFTTEAIPPSQVFTAFAAPRTDTSARLNGYVNPENNELTYHFEYSDDGGETWTALPDVIDTSNGLTQKVVAEELTGLDADTTYHYRFFAENAAGEATPQGEVKTFTTRPAPPAGPCSNETVRMKQHTTYLPDCRGIELVNNPDKGNQHGLPAAFGGSAVSRDGSRAIWQVAGGAPEAYTASSTSLLAKRTSTGWHSQGIAPPPDQSFAGGQLEYFLAEPIFSNPDLTVFLNDARIPSVDSTLVRVDDEQHEDVLKNYPDEGHDVPVGADMSDDGAHIVLIQDSTETAPLQLEDIGSGTPEILSLMPDETESSCGLIRPGLGKGKTGFINGLQWQNGYHMMSTTDASRVYFQVQPNGECGGLLGLYVRNREAGGTTLIDPGAAGRDPEFIRATPNGRAAYFATHSQLDPADENATADVYRWDEEADGSTCLTCEADPEVSLRQTGSTLAPILVSDDFSHIYFQSTKQLVPGKGKAGSTNLYVLSGGTIRFVASVTPEGPLLSADGNALVFLANEAGLTSDAIAAGRQLYRYEDLEGSLECVSCLRGETTSHSPLGFEGLFLGMSRDGSTVAFVTTEALAPLDVNRVNDIYSWRDGVQGLITDGVTEYESSESFSFAAPFMAGVSEDGRDIFFSILWSGATGFEEDGLANFYDARVGGGFEPPSPPVPCVEDSCQGPLQAAPQVDRGASSVFSGKGNVRAARGRCGALEVRRGGRCVSNRALARKACRGKRGRAKKRCIGRRVRRIDRIQQTQLRNERAQANVRRVK